MSGTRRLAAARLFAALTVTTACTGVGGGAGAGQGPTGESKIAMRDNFYARDLTRVPVGTPVTFSNEGRNDHNAIAVDDSWKTSDIIDPGTEEEVDITAAGVYRFWCTFHGTPDGEGMAATLVVGDVDYKPSGEGSEKQEPVGEATGVTRNVPGDYDTISDAVDAADPGDLVLVGPGTYREQVNVTTPSLVIRGTDRNTVVIDGEFERPNGINITADGVAVENLTVRSTAQNGLFWTGVTGYRASYVTAHNNEVYGIYAFDSTDGLFEHSYASGSSDAAFYIGQCKPCDAVITDITAEYSALGYSGTNASGNLQIINSTWRHNAGGIVPNTLDTELLPPVGDVDIVGNLIEDTGRTDVPVIAIEWPALGNGVVIAGGNDIRVERNRIANSAMHGIAVMPNLSKNFWTSSRNIIRGNVITGSGRADVAFGAPAGPGNCLAGNDLQGDTVPPAAAVLASCDGARAPWRWDLSTTAVLMGRFAESQTGQLPDNPVREAPVPPPQEQMPGGASAPVAPAVDVYAAAAVDLAAIAVPQSSDDVAARKVFTVSGVAFLAVGPWSVFFGLYLYLLPFVLYAAWVSLAFWDLARREDLSRAATLGWVAAILLIPFVGVIAYHVAARSPIPGWLRLAIVGGGIVAYAVILAVGTLVGGVV